MRGVPPIRIAVWGASRLWDEAMGCLVSHAAGIHFVGRWDGHPGTATSLTDVLLLDGSLDGILHACARIRRAGPRPRTILIAMDGVGRFALEALASGASGILGPEAGVGDLLKAIRVVQSGQIWATGNVIRRSVEAFAALRETSRLNEAALAHLSAREAEVARLVSVGLANKEVAAQLAISTGTVKAHLTQVFQKLGLRSRSELVACLRGLVGRPTTKVEASPSSQDQLTGVCPVCHAKAV